MEPESPKRKHSPYYVKQTNRGSVVVCAAHLVTDEIKTSEAYALRDALNAEHQKRHA